MSPSVNETHGAFPGVLLRRFSARVHMEHVVGGLHSSTRSLAGPEAVSYLPCYSCISVALPLTFASAEMTVAF